MVHKQGLELERSTPALSYQGTTSRFGAYRTTPGGMCTKYEIVDYAMWNMFWNNLTLDHKPRHDLEIQDAYKY